MGHQDNAGLAHVRSSGPGDHPGAHGGQRMGHQGNAGLANVRGLDQVDHPGLPGGQCMGYKDNAERTRGGDSVSMDT